MARIGETAEKTGFDGGIWKNVGLHTKVGIPGGKGRSWESRESQESRGIRLGLGVADKNRDFQGSWSSKWGKARESGRKVGNWSKKSKMWEILEIGPARESGRKVAFFSGGQKGPPGNIPVPKSEARHPAFFRKRFTAAFQGGKTSFLAPWRKETPFRPILMISNEDGNRVFGRPFGKPLRPSRQTAKAG